MTLKKTTHHQTRRANEQLALRTIYERGKVSRADVARLTGLTRTTVSDLVERLIQDGLVVEVGTGPSTGGKAPILLAVPADARLLIGVEVEHDRLSGAVVDLRGVIRSRRTAPLAERHGEAVLRELAGFVQGLISATEGPLAGVGIGTPGLIDTTAGIVRWAVGLDWHDVPVGPDLAALTGLPTVVVNDSQAAAMAEWVFGRHDNSSAMVVVKVGEGIGAGIIMGGRIYSGDDSGAGEVGHSRVRDEGDPCRCGSTGCLETVASARAVVDAAAQRSMCGEDTTLQPGAVTHETLVAAFRSGDALAREVILAAALTLGRVLGTVIGTLGSRDVVLIGPMTDYGDAWLEAVRHEARRSALPSLVERSTIHLGRSGEEAVTLGAAAMLMTSELGLALAA